MGKSVVVTFEGPCVMPQPPDLKSGPIFTPQLQVVFIETDLNSVSIISWILALSTAFAWSAYALVIHEPAILIPSLFQIPITIAIIIKMAIDRRPFELA